MIRWPFRRPSIESRQSVEDSELRLETAKHLSARAGAAASSLHETLTRNHFAEAVVKTIKGVP